MVLRTEQHCPWRQTLLLLIGCKLIASISTTEWYKSIFLFTRSGDWGNTKSNAIYFLLSCKELLSELFFVHGTLPITSTLWYNWGTQADIMSGHNGCQCAEPQGSGLGIKLSLGFWLEKSCSNHVCKQSECDSPPKGKNRNLSGTMGTWMKQLAENK